MVRAAISPGQTTFLDLDDVVVDLYLILDDDDDVDHLLHDVDQVDVLDDVVDDAHADDVDQILQLQPAPGVPAKSRPKEGRRKHIAKVLKKGLEESTQKSYAKQFAKFEEWCRENDEVALPADPEAIADYLIERAEEDGWRGATLKVAWAGIADRHRNNGYNEIAIHAGVRQTMRSLVKSDRRPQVQARPLRKEDLARIRGAAWVPRTAGGRRPRKETPAETRKRALLDIAICSTLRDAMLRRSELAALRWGDVQFLDSGLALIHIRRSKTDQEGKGAEQALGPECAQDLRAIMPEGALVDPELPVIGLSGSQIGRRVRAMCIEAGLGDGFTGHSGRVGMAKDLRAARRGDARADGRRALGLNADGGSVYPRGASGQGCHRQVLRQGGRTGSGTMSWGERLLSNWPGVLRTAISVSNGPFQRPPATPRSQPSQVALRAGR